MKRNMNKGGENIHIYQIELEPYENGQFYHRDDGILTLTCDREYPYKSNRLSIVGHSGHTSVGSVAYRKNPQSYTCEQERIVIPTFGVLDEEWYDVMTDNIIAVIESAKGVYDNGFSVFVTRKKFEGNVWEVGLAAVRGYGGNRFVRNKDLERYVDHLLDFGEV